MAISQQALPYGAEQGPLWLKQLGAAGCAVLDEPDCLDQNWLQLVAAGTSAAVAWLVGSVRQHWKAVVLCQSPA